MYCRTLSSLLKALRELTKYGALVILPTGSDEFIKHIADEVICVDPKYDIDNMCQFYFQQYDSECYLSAENGIIAEDGIKGMLDEYESDHHTGMDTAYVASLIWEQTSGCPFLVSRICQLIDERVCKTMPLFEAWTKDGFMKAVKLLLADNNSLFQSNTK